MNPTIIDTLVNGISTNLTDATRERLTRSIRVVDKQLEETKVNRSSKSLFKPNNSASSSSSNTDMNTDVYTNISDMINGSQTGDVGGFTTLLDSLTMKNKRYYSIIKDYEIMPILIPQINRVLMFLTNECLSPDIQSDQTFTITYLADTDEHQIQKTIDDIKKEMKLDNMLREVYSNRHRLGNEYYTVIDYNETFNHMLDMMQQKGLVESTAGMTDSQFLEYAFQQATDVINECTVQVPIQVETSKGTITENVDISLDHLNIKIERTSLLRYTENAQSEILHETYSRFSRKEMMKHQTLNEAVVDMSKMTSIVQDLKKKKLDRCTIERLDPAKVFKLEVGGKIIGYFYVMDLNENDSNVINFSQALKNQLLKTKAANMSIANKSAEEVIARELSEKIINKFDPNIGINRLEDIDLLHDFIRNNEIYQGNKRIIFYYEDEIFDMSRADGSLLTNAVFFTKLYSTLLLNNIMTKVLRGRGRQIHMVKTGVSPSIQRYIQNAMANLTMPENNLGTLHGSFEQILNPFNSSSDIVLPVEDTSDRYIETDYIPGQDVNMDDDFLKFLLNSIVSSFGLDAAVIDATNGNLQFARTLSMESLQICNNIRNEQQDLHDSWERMCLEVLQIMGDDDVRNAIDNGLVKVDFFEPESLIIQNTVDAMSNVKSYAEGLADLIPEFNEDGSEMKRMKFIYGIVKDKLNIDWATIETQLKEISIDQIGSNLDADIRKIVAEYMQNTEQRQYGDQNGDGVVSEDDNVSNTDDFDDLY